MDFGPDILVTSEDSSQILAVIEAKRGSRSDDTNATGLRHYMWRSRCPLGLIIRPDRVSIFRDSFRREDESAIEQVAAFEIPKIMSGPSDMEFEDAAQHWLESLTWKVEADGWNADAWQALSSNVLPVLRSGELRAAHPRLKAI